MTKPDEPIPHSDTADALEQSVPVTESLEDEEDYPRADRGADDEVT